MSFQIIERRNDNTTIAILGYEPLIMEYDQTKNDKKSPRRSLKQFPIFNHPFLTRGSKKHAISVETNSNNQQSNQMIRTSNNQQSNQMIRASNNQQSNQMIRASNNQQSNQIMRTSNNQQSNQMIRASNNHQSNQIMRTSNSLQSNQMMRTSNNQQSNQIVNDLSNRPNTFQAPQSFRNDDSNFNNNGFSGQLLLLYDSLNPENNQRFSANDNPTMNSNDHQISPNTSNSINFNFPSLENNRPHNRSGGNIPLFRTHGSIFNQMPRKNDSDYIVDGHFGGNNLNRGDFLDDTEFNQRFPNIDEDHYHLCLPSNRDMNGMSHHTVDQEDKKNDNLCLICLTEFKTGEKTYKLRCGHIFHENCLVPWRENHNSCPVCRQKIDIDQPADSSQTCLIS